MKLDVWDSSKESLLISEDTTCVLEVVNGKRLFSSGELNLAVLSGIHVRVCLAEELTVLEMRSRSIHYASQRIGFNHA
jgi:hypothetical protein